MGQVLHARLRMGCSSLNADLYGKNIVPSPSCSCGGFESAYHFLFMCPNFNDIRYAYLPNNLYTLDIHQLPHWIPSVETMLKMKHRSYRLKILYYIPEDLCKVHFPVFTANKYTSQSQSQKHFIHSGHKHDKTGTVHIQNIAANGSL